MNEEKTQIADGVASVLNAELDCCFNEIIKTLKKYHETALFDIPLCLTQGFNDFVETREVLMLGGFTDSKTHCYVTFNKDTGIFKKYHNGIGI